MESRSLQTTIASLIIVGVLARSLAGQVVSPARPNVSARLSQSEPKPEADYPRTDTFKGVIRDHDGVPVSGAFVRLESPALGAAPIVLTTDEQGRFSHPAKGAETAALFVTRQGFRPYRTRPRAAADGPIEISLTRIFYVTGRVLDAATGQPLEIFTVIPGLSFSVKKPFSWSIRLQQQGTAGTYSFENDRHGYIGIAIEAEGYLPGVSPHLVAPGWHTHDFKLERGSGMGGQVLNPDGKPARGATLVLGRTGEIPVLDAESQLHPDQAGFALADGEGRFQMPARVAPDTIVAAHPDGFIVLPFSEFKPPHTVGLQPWGRVEGIVRTARRPNRQLTIRLVPRQSRPMSEPAIRWTMAEPDGRPDADGRFAFDRVPPGDYEAALGYILEGADVVVTNRRVPITTVSGQVAHAVIGGDGRPVRGQIRLVGENPGPIVWRRQVHSLRRVDQEPGDQEYPVLFDDDGSFQVDDVLPGAYELTIALTEAAERPGEVRVLGALNQAVLVPKDDGESNPVDLGILKLEIKQRSRNAIISPLL